MKRSRTWCFIFPLISVPPALLQLDGSLCETDKSVLAKKKLMPRVEQSGPSSFDVEFIDGFYVIHHLVTISHQNLCIQCIWYSFDFWYPPFASYQTASVKTEMSVISNQFRISCIELASNLGLVQKFPCISRFHRLRLLSLVLRQSQSNPFQFIREKSKALQSFPVAHWSF